MTVTAVEVDPAPLVKCVVTPAEGDKDGGRGRSATKRSNSVCSGALKRQ